ncbi:MAG: DNA polymerase III subunit delta' [Anaerolineae bacterium]
MWHVVGHGWAVRLLQKGLEDGRVAHAYLFAGPPQVGKTTLALEFARALLCTGEHPPCDNCPACRRVQAGTHPDLHRVEGTGKGGAILIEQVRELRQGAVLAPVHGPYRVYVVPHMERATAEAANALLKTLEEPPPQVVLLLTTSHLASLLPTIVSRCQVLVLRPLPREEVEVALRERWHLAEADAALLARLSGGRLGWAVRASQDPQVLARRRSWLDALHQALRGSRLQRLRQAEALATLPEEELQEVLDLWAGYFRDLLVWKGGYPEGVHHVDQSAALEEVAKGCPLERAREALRAILATWDALQRNANRRLALEVLLLSLPGVI